jgi:hypothetical protein
MMRVLSLADMIVPPTILTLRFAALRRLFLSYNLTLRGGSSGPDESRPIAFRPRRRIKSVPIAAADSVFPTGNAIS